MTPGSHNVTPPLHLFAAALLFHLAPGASRADESSAAGPSPTPPWVAPDEAAARPNPFPPDSDSLVRGAALYELNCAACHGARGTGDGPTRDFVPMNPPNLADPVFAARHSDGEWFWKISTGRPPMHPFEGHLQSDDIWHVINHIRTLSSDAAAGGVAVENPADGNPADSPSLKKKRRLPRSIGRTEIVVALLLATWIYMFKRRRRLSRGR